MTNPLNKMWYSSICRFLLLVTALLWQAAAALSAPSEAGDTLRLRLVFAGDIMGHDSQIRSAEVTRDSLYDYTPCFEYLEPLLRSSDLAVGNLELTLPGKPPYKGYPQFRSPDDLALALRYAGFNLLATANNHSNDAGKNGVLHTIETLDNYHFYHTGTFQHQAERDAYYPLIVYKSGFKLVFLNYTYGTNGLPTPAPTIVNLIDEAQIEKDMAVARQLQPDAIIAIMHWGDEYQRVNNKSQEQLAQKLFSWGADLVIGAHPHVVQPIREQTLQLSDSTQKKVVVAYSLGNFISGQTKTHTDGGILFGVELAKSIPDNKTWISDHQYLLIWRYVEEREAKKTFRVLPVSAAEQEGNPLQLDQNARNAMSGFAKSTRDHLGKYDSREWKVTWENLFPPSPEHPRIQAGNRR